MGLKSQCNKSPKLTLPARKGGLSSQEELSHKIAISSPFSKCWGWHLQNIELISPTMMPMPQPPSWRLSPASVWKEEVTSGKYTLFGRVMFRRKRVNWETRYMEIAYIPEISTQGSYMWHGQKNAMLGHWDPISTFQAQLEWKEPKSKVFRDHAIHGKKGEGGCISLGSSDQEMSNKVPREPPMNLMKCLAFGDPQSGKNQGHFG